MSYQEKRSIVSIVSGIIILTAYCLYVIEKYQNGLVAPGDLKFWATTILTFIGIGIVATIVILIVFHIMLSVSIAVSQAVKDGNYDDKEIEKAIKVDMIEDEMDKMIEFKSMRIGFLIAGIGFVAGLFALVFNYSAVVMLNIFFISFSVGSILEGFVKIFYYRRGLNHG
jgi:Na+-transporting methylmalonyl-CoA/oxaloacetate decarboxylase gamma subunit